LIAHAPSSNPFSSGVLALLVHVGFFALLIFGISWRVDEPPGMVVDLWSDLPRQPAPPSVAPPPKMEPTPKPDPVPVKKFEPKPSPPTPIPKAQIVLKEKKRKQEKPKPKPEPMKPAKQDPAKQEKSISEQVRQLEIAHQQQAQAELTRLAAARQSAAQASVVNEYSERIKGKIRQRLNRTLCGEGNPQLLFDIALLPTGQILGNPILRKSSGIPACDKAVENAILQSDPLPVPPQPEVFAEFRNLHLNFKPNE